MSPSKPSLSAGLLATGLLVSSLMACGAGKRRAAEAPVDATGIAPVLSAAEAPVYAVGGDRSPDPIVQLAVSSVVEPTGATWDEPLSGAAGSLALDGRGVTMSQARWAGWRAGSPLPLRGVLSGTSETAGIPPELAANLATVVGDRLGGQARVGLARARVGEIDHWVALVAAPMPGVPAFPRQHDSGDSLDLPLPEGSTWTLVGPSGRARSGTGTLLVELREAGEWWLEAALPDGSKLSLPLYVGMEMPTAPLLDLPGETATSPAEARDIALVLVEDVRLAFEAPMLSEDPTLDTLALSPLDAVVAGTWEREPNIERLRGAGFVGGSADQAACRGRTVALCMDALLRSAGGREALLDTGHRLIGAAARVETDGVTLVLNLASE